jgi:hypothetical protein
VQRSRSHDVGFRNHRSNYESGLTYWYRGNSWPAISQINFASRFTHPNLKAIAPWEGMTEPVDENRGKHTIYTGGDYASYLVLSFI